MRRQAQLKRREALEGIKLIKEEPKEPKEPEEQKQNVNPIQQPIQPNQSIQNQQTMKNIASKQLVKAVSHIVNKKKQKAFNQIERLGNKNHEDDLNVKMGYAQSRESLTNEKLKKSKGKLKDSRELTNQLLIEQGENQKFIQNLNNRHEDQTQFYKGQKNHTDKIINQLEEDKKEIQKQIDNLNVIIHQSKAKEQEDNNKLLQEQALKNEETLKVNSLQTYVQQLQGEIQKAQQVYNNQFGYEQNLNNVLQEYENTRQQLLEAQHQNQIQIDNAHQTNVSKQELTNKLSTLQETNNKFSIEGNRLFLKNQEQTQQIQIYEQRIKELEEQLMNRTQQNNEHPQPEQQSRIMMREMETEKSIRQDQKKQDLLDLSTYFRQAQSEYLHDSDEEDEHQNWERILPLEITSPQKQMIPKDVQDAYADNGQELINTLDNLIQREQQLAFKPHDIAKMLEAFNGQKQNKEKLAVYIQTLKDMFNRATTHGQKKNQMLAIVKDAKQSLEEMGYQVVGRREGNEGRTRRRNQ